MHKGLKKIGLGLVAVGLSIVLLLTGAIPVCEAGPAEKVKVVRIGNIGGYTGPAASTTLSAHLGINDYPKYMNGEIDIDETLVPEATVAQRKFFQRQGIKIEAKWEDTTSLSVSKSLTAFKRLEGAGVVAILSTDIATVTEVLKERHQDAEIPSLWYSALTPAMVTYPIRWIIGCGPGQGPEAATFAKWAKEGLTEDRPLRIAIIGYESVSSREAAAGLEEWAPKLGVEVVNVEFVPFAVLDSSTEWLRTIAKEPDWVYVPACMTALVVIVKDAARLGVQEKGIKLCTYDVGIDDAILKPIGKAGEGWHLITFAPVMTEVDLRGIRFTLEMARECRGMKPEDVSMHYAAGLLFFNLPLCEAIKVAIEKMGYENLTGRAVRDALMTLKDFDTEYLPPITLTEEHPYMNPKFRIYEVREGKIWPITDWIPSVYEYPELTEQG